MQRTTAKSIVLIAFLSFFHLSTCVQVSKAQQKQAMTVGKPSELVATDPEIRGLLDDSATTCSQLNVDNKLDRLQKAISLADQRGLIGDRGLAEATLASAYISRGDLELGFTTAKKAMQDAIDARNKVLEADLLVSLAAEARVRGNTQEAIDLLSKSLNTSAKAGSFYEKAHALGELGVVQLGQGKSAEAASSIDEALKIDTLNGFAFEAIHLVYRGYYLGMTGKIDQAVEVLIQARTKAISADDPYCFLRAEEAYALALAKSGKTDQAISEMMLLKNGQLQTFVQGLEQQKCLALVLDYPIFHLTFVEGLTSVLEAANQREQELAIWQEAYSYSHEQRVLVGEAEAAQKIADLSNQFKRSEEALKYYAIAGNLYRRLQNEPLLAHVELSQSLLLIQVGRGKEAVSLEYELASYAKRHSLRRDEFIAYSVLAEIYQPVGDAEGARDALEKALALVRPGPFDEELNNRVVLEDYLRLADVYKALNLPTQELINIDRAFFVAVHLGDEKTQKSELAYLDQRLKELRTREVVEESVKNGHLVGSLTYSIILYLRDGYPSKPSDDKSNFERMGNLPSQIVNQPGGAKALADIVDQLGPILGLEKVPTLIALGRYYIGEGANPVLAERYASMAEKLLQDAKVDNAPNRVASACVLALSYSRQSKTAQATNKITECLSLADKTNDPVTIRYAQAMDVTMQIERGDIAAARNSLELLKKDMPDQPYVLGEYALALSKVKLYEQASSELDRAIKIYSSLGKQNLAGALYVLMANALDSDPSEKAKALQLKYLLDAQHIYLEMKSDSDLADVLGFIGDSHFKAAQTKNAVSNYEKARELGLKLKREDIVAISDLRLGTVYKSQKDFVKAIDLHSRAAQTFQDLKMPALELIALERLAADYSSSGDPEKALSLLLQAKDRAGNASTEIKYEVRYHLGWAYGSLGQYENALVSFQEALEITNQAGDIAHSAYLHLAIAEVSQLLGQWDDAKAEAEEALRSFQGIGDQHGEVTSLDKLLSIYGDRTSPLRNFDQAMQYYEKAKVLGAQESIQFSLVELYLAAGRYVDAASAANEAIANCARSKNSECEANGYVELAEAKGLSGDLLKARAAFNKARDLGADSIDPYSHGRYLYREALLLTREQKLNESLTVYEELIPLIEKIKGSLGLKDEKSFSENYGFIYGDLVSLLYTMSQREASNKTTFAAQALEYTEKNKARQFADSWGRVFVSQMRKSLPADIQETERTLLSKREKLLLKLNSNSALAAPPPTIEKEHLELELASAQNELNAFILELRKSYPQYAAVAYPEPIKFSKLPLRRAETFIEFKVTDDATFAWIIQNQDGVRNQITLFYKIPRTRSWLLERLSTIQKGLNSGHFEIAGRKMSEQLFAELFPGDAANIIANSQEVIFVPDDILFILPFELFSPAASRDEFVLLNKGTTYYPSAVSFELARTARHETNWPKTFLGIGDPVTSQEDERKPLVDALKSTESASSGHGAENRGSEKFVAVDQSSLKTRGCSFDSLPNTKVEVQNIASLLKSRNEWVEVRLGIEATKNELLQTDLSKFRFLHFATHATTKCNAEPSLVLSYDGGAQSHMFLSMSEISGLKLDSESVVLSACNTGTGEIRRAEGVMSLGRAFLAAGSSSVTVSLWQVSDESTAELMGKYYQGLLAGKPKNIALAEARRALFSGRYKDPFYWAPFIVIGE